MSGHKQLQPHQGQAQPNGSQIDLLLVYLPAFLKNLWLWFSTRRSIAACSCWRSFGWFFHPQSLSECNFSELVVNETMLMESLEGERVGFSYLGAFGLSWDGATLFPDGLFVSVALA